MSSQSLTLYLLHIIYFLFYCELFYIFTRRDDARRIQQDCFIYRSIFAIPALRKRRVQGHCAAYHFRMYNRNSSYNVRSFLSIFMNFYCFMKYLRAIIGNICDLDTSFLCSMYVSFLCSMYGLCVTNPPIRLMCPTSVCLSTCFVSGL